LPRPLIYNLFIFDRKIQIFCICHGSIYLVLLTSILILTIYQILWVLSSSLSHFPISLGSFRVRFHSANSCLPTFNNYF
jgi:hypothetical protein